MSQGTSKPLVNPGTRHPARVQNVGTVNIVVKDEVSLANAEHSILAYIKRVDRFGVVNVNISGAPKGAKAPKAKTAEESMLD